MSELEWVSPKEGVIDARKVAGGVLLVIRAEDIRRTYSGLHAKVTVAVTEVGAKSAPPMLSDVMNIDKEDARHDFVNKLYGIKGRRDPKFPPEFIEMYSRASFERDLYRFSEECYGQLIGHTRGEYVAGDSDKTTPGFFVDGLVLKEGGTILYAPPKSAKSYTAMLLAVSMDAGVQSLFHVQQVKVMYLNLERGKGSMSRRLGLVNRVLGLPAERPLLMLNKRGRSLSDIYDAAKETIEKEGVQCVVLDSLSRVGFGDLNGNEEANKAMDYLNRLCDSWVAIGHTSKADETSIFGSMMFGAAMDIGVNVKRQRMPDGTLGIGFHVKDTNDTGVPPLRVLAYEFDDYGLKRVRDAQRHEFPEIEEASQSPRTNAERIYDQLVSFGKCTQIELSDDLRIHPGTISRELNEMVKDGKVARIKEGRSFSYFVPAKFEGQP